MAKGFGTKPQPQKKLNKRQKAYLNLISELLECPPGKEEEVLQASKTPIDAELVKTMGSVAMMLAKDGDRSSADFLLEIADRLGEPLGLRRRSRSDKEGNDSGELSRFVSQFMSAIATNNGNPRGAHPILQGYIERDEKFLEKFRNWSEVILQEAPPEEAASLAKVLATFGSAMSDFPEGDRSENIETAIASYQAALKVLTRESHALQWAETQNLLAIACCKRVEGSRAENLERGIAAYQEALQVFSREEFPEQWSKTQSNLGLAYRQRISGDKAENLEKAIAAHRQTLEVRTREAFPELWAGTQMNLAADYRQRTRGKREENQGLAIAACEAALQVYTSDAYPEERAKTKITLGNIYRELVGGDRAENLEKAILANQEALEIFSREAFPSDWARVKTNLGNVYIDSDRIEEAIACYRAALEVWTPDDYPENCFRAGSNMGNVAFAAGLWSEAIEGYHAAIEASEEILAETDSDSEAEEVEAEAARIYEKILQACINNGQPDLAKEYRERSESQEFAELEDENEMGQFVLRILSASYQSQGDPKVVYPILEENEDILDDYFLEGWQRLLGIIQANAEPEEFARVFQELAASQPGTLEPDPSFMETMILALGAIAFNSLIMHFPGGSREINLEVAIAGYEGVAYLFNPEGFPEQWAGNQIDLGVAYRNRLRGDAKENIEKAIACWESALEFFSSDESPEVWARIQNNLAITWAERTDGERADNLERAIVYCQEVLEICDRDSFPEQWGIANINLAGIYSQRLAGDREDNLQLARRCYENAALIFTREAYPDRWQDIQKALA